MADDGQYDSQINLEQEEYERETTIEQEDSELEITMQPEAATVYGGSVVNSINGQVGDVILTTSDLENTSDYQTGAQVQSAIAGKQDTLTAGTNIQINNDVISATDTTYSAGSGLDLDGTTFSVDTNTIATVQDVTNEATTRENADINLQGQLNDKQNTEDNSLDTTSKTVVGAINEVNSIAKGSNQALSFANYSAMVTEFNSLAGNEYNVGQNVMVVTLEVPDLWISGIESTSSTYTYTTDEAFTAALATNGYVQVGYYKLSALETQKVDLTDYVTNTDYASNATGGVVKTNINYGTSVDSNGSLRGTTKTYEDYGSMHNLGLISKVTLENVITGKGLVSNTDYGSFATAGVVKASSTYGTQFASTGAMYAQTKTYEQYTDSTSPGLFVGKGTLENVIAGKNLATKSDVPKYYFGTCETAAATRAKIVECEGFTLEEGATISVYFTNAQAYNGYPQLNVNGTGNIAVVYKGGSAGIRYMWSAGEIIDFTYHNEYWVCHGRALASTTYYGITKLANSAISTSSSVALTPAVVNALAENMITGYPAYSAAATYAVGDRVRYSSYAYECNTAITTPESWTAAHWTALDPLQTQIDALEARIRALENQ